MFEHMRRHINKKRSWNTFEGASETRPATSTAATYCEITGAREKGQVMARKRKGKSEKGKGEAPREKNTAFPTCNQTARTAEPKPNSISWLSLLPPASGMRMMHAYTFYPCMRHAYARIHMHASFICHRCTMMASMIA